METFVVQQHKARRMHYDVRFEVDGVMPSWAVPKGPSYDPKVKRLAAQTPDHPLDYQHFEGVIPKGEYGAGAVSIWDKGTYRNITEKDGQLIDMRMAIDQGHFSVWIDGEKLVGGWSFIRTGIEGDQPSWMMVKSKDDHADPSKDVVKTQPQSVVSGMTIDEIGADEDAPSWTHGIATWKPPMLAERSTTVPAGGGWIYERKLDGLRCVAVRNGSEVELWSRNHLSFNHRFPHIVDDLAQLPIDNFVLDGELVAFEGDQTSFGRLQNSAGAKTYLYAFDLIHLLGQDTTGLSLLQRKTLLSKTIDETETLKLVLPLEGDGEALLSSACSSGWEGLIAKRAESQYRSGRSSDWRKLKCFASQEIVIGGWTDPKGMRVGIGALLVGYYDDSGALRYAGKVGTGFNADSLRMLLTELKTREVDASPFANEVKEKGPHWARPELVANVRFSEWTGDGKLRHSIFEGLRPDKDPRQVIRES